MVIIVKRHRLAFTDLLFIQAFSLASDQYVLDIFKLVEQLAGMNVVTSKAVNHTQFNIRVDPDWIKYLINREI